MQCRFKERSRLFEAGVVVSLRLLHSLLHVDESPTYLPKVKAFYWYMMAFSHGNSVANFFYGMVREPIQH